MIEAKKPESPPTALPEQFADPNVEQVGPPSSLTPPRPTSPRSGRAYSATTPWPPLQALLWTAIAMLTAFVVAGAVAIGVMALKFDFTTALVLGTLGQQAAVIGLAWWLAGWKSGQRIDVLALHKPRSGLWSYVASLVTLVVVVVAMSSAIHAIDRNLIKSDLQQFSDILNSPIWWAMFPMVGIGAPLAEELLFRGFLFSALAQSRLGLIGAAIITSAIWALVHSYSLVGIMQVFLIGLIFSWILVKTGSLRVPIVVHGIYNMALTALLVSEFGKGILKP